MRHPKTYSLDDNDHLPYSFQSTEVTGRSTGEHTLSASVVFIGTIDLIVVTNVSVLLFNRLRKISTMFGPRYTIVGLTNLLS